jgi:branched-chain amino acid aminotransferase
MIYLNNKVLPKKKALISVFDHGFLYGDGIYETLMAYNGVVFKLDEHIERLFRSAALIGLSIPKTPVTLKKAVYETLLANKQKDAVIRISVSRGEGPTGLDPALCSKPTLVIMSGQFKSYPQGYYKKGVKITIADTRRNYYKAIDPKIKSLNFLNNILAKREAIEQNAYEALMLNYRGYIAEGTISNVFFVKDGVLFTPDVKVGILDGITRSIILNIAKELKIKRTEGNFRPADLYKSDEVFISNTTMEAMPVREVDNTIIAMSPGKVTKMIHKAYKKKVAEYIRKHGKASPL